MSKPRIGFIGLGLMGQAFTAHLVESGYQVTGFDIDADKVSKAAPTCTVFRDIISRISSTPNRLASW